MLAVSINKCLFNTRVGGSSSSTPDSTPVPGDSTDTAAAVVDMKYRREGVEEERDDKVSESVSDTTQVNTLELYQFCWAATSTG